MNDTPDDLEFIARYAGDAARRAADEGRHDDAESMRARRVAAIRALAADVLRKQIEKNSRYFDTYVRGEPLDPLAADDVEAARRALLAARFGVEKRALLVAEIDALYRALDAVEGDSIKLPKGSNPKWVALSLAADAADAARSDR